MQPCEGTRSIHIRYIIDSGSKITKDDGARPAECNNIYQRTSKETINTIPNLEVILQQLRHKKELRTPRINGIHFDQDNI